MADVRKHFVFYGRVQGVGFRYTAKYMAQSLDLTGWVSYEDGTVSFSLADAAAYRTAGASKAIPGFDAIDYGQEDYVFGTKEQDARHWDSVLLEIFETYADTLAPLFNSGAEQ